MLKEGASKTEWGGVGGRGGEVASELNGGRGVGVGVFTFRLIGRGGVLITD